MYWEDWINFGRVGRMVNPSRTEALRVSDDNDGFRRVMGTPSICKRTQAHSTITATSTDHPLTDSKNRLAIAMRTDDTLPHNRLQGTALIRIPHIADAIGETRVYAAMIFGSIISIILHGEVRMVKSIFLFLCSSLSMQHS